MSATKSAAWPALNIYRDGGYGYAYNPTLREWEVYALDAGGGVEEFLCFRATKEEASTEAGALNARNIVQREVA